MYEMRTIFAFFILNQLNCTSVRVSRFTYESLHGHLGHKHNRQPNSQYDQGSTNNYLPNGFPLHDFISAL